MVNHLLPETLEEALEALARKQHLLFAGGTDLMVQKRAWAGLPRNFEHPVLFTSRIAKLNFIEKRSDHLAVGATCSLEMMLEYPDTPDLFKTIIGEMASPGIRNHATLAGNIANASPAGDTLVGLYLYDATIVLKSLRGERLVPIADFITGVRKIDLAQDEMITEIRIPHQDFTHIDYVKVGPRKADAISKIAFAGAAKTNDLTVSDIRAAFGAVFKTVLRSPATEAMLKGMRIADIKADLASICEAYARLLQPIDDQRSNKEYRKAVAINLLARFIKSL